MIRFRNREAATTASISTLLGSNCCANPRVLTMFSVHGMTPVHEFRGTSAEFEALAVRPIDLSLCLRRPLLLNAFILFSNPKTLTGELPTPGGAVPRPS